MTELGSVRLPRKPERFASIGVEHHKPCLYLLQDGPVKMAAITIRAIPYVRVFPSFISLR